MHGVPTLGANRKALPRGVFEAPPARSCQDMLQCRCCALRSILQTGVEHVGRLVGGELSLGVCLEILSTQNT